MIKHENICLIIKLIFFPKQKLQMSKKPDTKKHEDDDSTLRLYNLYRKKCDNTGSQQHPFLKQKLQQVLDNGKLQNLHYWQELGPVQTRLFMQACFDIDYQHLKVLKLWKTKIGDEGLRGISKYLSKSNSLQKLDLLDNNISDLGCQFLGKSLASPLSSLTKLKLDDNLIGTQGLKNLVFGLRQNPKLQKISLKYCNIDGKGSRYIQQMLANINTKIRSIKLQGNPIGNEGMYQILRAINISGETLQKINIADVKMDLLKFRSKNKKDKKQVENPEIQQDDEKDPDEIVFPGQQKKQKVKKKQVALKPKQQQIKKQILSEKSPTLSPTLSPKLQQQHSQSKQGQEVFILQSIAQQTIQQKIIHQLQGIMRKNMIIWKYNINFNPMSDDVGELILEMVSQNVRIKEIQLPTSVSYEITDALDTVIRKRTGRLRLNKGKGKSKKKTDKKKKK